MSISVTFMKKNDENFCDSDSEFSFFLVLNYYQFPRKKKKPSMRYSNSIAG